MIAAEEQMTASSTIIPHTIEVHYWSENTMDAERLAAQLEAAERRIRELEAEVRDLREQIMLDESRAYADNRNWLS
jgi:cell division protein FtsB